MPIYRMQLIRRKRPWPKKVYYTIDVKGEDALEAMVKFKRLLATAVADGDLKAYKDYRIRYKVVSI